jgi:hypothetical protein
MCPACIATMTILVAGSTSTGGLTALALNKFRRKNAACKVARDPVHRRSPHEKD